MVFVVNHHWWFFQFVTWDGFRKIHALNIRACTVQVPLLRLEAEEGTHLSILFFESTGGTDGAKNKTLAARLALEK